MNRIALALAAAFLALPAVAQHAPHAPAPAQLAQAAAKDLADGEVRRIDKANGKITLKHGEIKSVNMGPMTMAFTVKPPALLDNVAVGDKVKFAVEEVKGDYVVTSIQKAK